MFRYPEILDHKKVLAYLPHRAPFLLVDRILEISGPHPIDDEESKNKLGMKVIGLKNVTINEPFFTGHFPEMPVMPGVLILETMAQVSSFALYPKQNKNGKNATDGMQCVLVGVDDARFRVPVVPGDQLKIESVVKSSRKTLWSYECKAFVDDRLVAEATILANLIPISEKRVF